MANYIGNETKESTVEWERIVMKFHAGNMTFKKMRRKLKFWSLKFDLHIDWRLGVNHEA